MPAKVLEGPTMIRVGERARGDKTYATDEYLLAPPGTIVAPRKKDEEPTPENAARAIIAKAQELGMLPGGGKGMATSKLSAFEAFKAARATAGGTPSRPATGSMAAPVGPPVYRQMATAAVGAGTTPPVASSAPGTQGAAVNPHAEALKAINAVSTTHGVDPTQAAGMLNAPAPPATAPMGNTLDVAQGANPMANFLNTLLGGANLTGPDLMLAQLAFLQNLGVIDPRLIGVTDPAEFRRILMEGQGMPTLDAQKQRFQESLFGFSHASPQRGNVPTVAG